MNSTGLLNMFRSEMRDEARPYLWSDLDVFGYMSEAQTMFCRLTGGIPAILQVSVSANATYFKLPDSLMKIREVRVLGAARDLELINREDLANGQYRRLLDVATSTPEALLVGDVDGFARLLPQCTVPVSLTIVGHRLPQNMELASQQDLEIRTEHHRSLLLWMGHLAHLKQDAETYDRGRSDQFKMEFEEYCRLAAAEQDRRAHKPRTIQYGGL